MQLQTTTDYAIQMLIYLATKNSIVTASELSEHLNISQKYVYDIGHRLKKADYITTVLGAFGGYSIKASEEISLYDIVLLFEGTVKIDRPLNESGSQTYGINAANNYYTELQEQIEEGLKTKMLATLRLQKQ